MAERRMLSRRVIDTDEFLDMPPSAQCLYFHLCMNADDDGFVDKPRSIIRNVRATEDDFKILCVKTFVLTFDSGVMVIRHWKMHNCIKNDRYHATIHQEEKKLLTLDDNKCYQFDAAEAPKIEDGSKVDPECIQDGSNPDPEVRLGKDRIDKVRDTHSGNRGSGGKNRFKKPTVDEVREYCRERNNGIDPQAFLDFYESKGWVVGKSPMKDWKAAVRTWEQRRKDNGERGCAVDPLERYGYSSYGDRASPSG